jgi:hypothetical protein
MIVTCKYNKGNILPNDLLSLAGWDANKNPQKYPLTTIKKYL